MVVIAVALLIWWAWLFSKEYFSYSSYTKEKVLIKNSIFVAYVADSEEERMMGLSGKKFLPTNTGMLFEFDKNSDCGIWMKDMLFPIDIIWLDKNKRIVSKVSDAEPSTYPKVFYPPEKCMYVLEVRAGLIKERGLKLGDEILFGTNSSDSTSTTSSTSTK